MWSTLHIIICWFNHATGGTQHLFYLAAQYQDTIKLFYFYLGKALMRQGLRNEPHVNQSNYIPKLNIKYLCQP